MKKYILLAIAIGTISYLVFAGSSLATREKYSAKEMKAQVADAPEADTENAVPDTALDTVPKAALPGDDIVVTHIKTPSVVKGVYMTSWVAGTNSLKNKVEDLIDTTEINTVVIDIKDYTGKVSFDPGNVELAKYGSIEHRIRNIKGLIDELHKKNIYVIGRVAAFQDSHLIQTHPEWAVKTLSDKNKVWRDHKGIGWVDAGQKDVWAYLSLIAHASYDVGFDEINFDYIRFPSDGNMKDIYYASGNGAAKPEVLKSFFQFVDQDVRQKGIPTSADLFGMTTTNTDDLNIGQVLENTLPYFDFVCPMVYPSHFPATWNGYKNPAANPYEVIQYSMSHAVERAKAMGEDPLKLRPWLQDFNLGATYTKEMVQAQIKATYDVGLTSWLMWDAANTYTKEAFKAE